MVRALGPSLLLLVAAIAAAASTGSAARASARGLARRAAQSLSWLDQADQAEQAVQAEQPDQVSPVEDLSGLALGLGAGLGAGLAPPPCFSSDCGAVIRDTSRDAQGSAGFDTDLEAMEVAAEEAGDNALSALSALSGLPEPRDHPITAHKRTLQYLCENVAVEAEGSAGLSGLFRAALLQCPCQLGFRPLQLGEAHYPHHLNVVQCASSPHCRTRVYPVPLLTRGTAEQSNPTDEEHQAPLVPESLRKHWRFEIKYIPVACECVHSSGHVGHAQQHGK